MTKVTQDQSRYMQIYGKMLEQASNTYVLELRDILRIRALGQVYLTKDLSDKMDMVDNEIKKRKI